MAVTVQKGKTLETKRIHSLTELAIDTPGLNFYEEGPGRASFNIRGISSAVGSSTVAISLDDISLTSFNTFQVNPDLYDLDRVEVLRGPQGTLYGEGALGGAIRLISNKPNLSKLGLRVRASEYHPYRPQTPNSPDGGHRHDYVASLPLVKDRLALRVVSSQFRDGGFIDQPERGLRNANFLDSRSDRFVLSAALTPNTLMDLSHLEGRSVYGALSRGNANYQQFGRADTLSFDAINATSLKISHSFSTLDLDLIQTRFQRKFQSRQEGLGDLERLVRPDPSLAFLTNSALRTLVESVPIEDNGIQDKRSSEVRGVTTDLGPVKVTTGYYFENNQSVYQPVWTTQTTAGVSDRQLLEFLQASGIGNTEMGQSLLLDARYQSKSVLQAVYLNADYRVSPRLQASMGTRYTRQNLTATTGGVYLGFPVTGDIDQTFTVMTPRFAVSYQMDGLWIERGQVYASAAKGFRAGGANNRIDNALISQQDNVNPFYRPDTLWTYELGLKAVTMQGRLFSQLAWYRNEWKDVQSFTLSQSGLVPFITNVGSAAGNGMDMSFSWKVTPNLMLNTMAAFNQMAFVTDTPQKARGNPMDYNPKRTLGLGALYQHAALGGRLSYRLDYVWRDRTFVTPTANDIRSSDIFRVLNGRVALDFLPSWAERLELAFYARNILNFKGRLDPNFSANSDSTLAQARLRPRTVGLELSLDY